jgi:hypothetical protein
MASSFADRAYGCPVDPFEAEHVLRRALIERGVKLVDRRAGVIGAGDDAMTAWDAFKNLVTEPVAERFVFPDGETLVINPSDDGDLLFFDASLSPRLSDDDNPHIGAEEPEVFLLDFTRQFSFDDEDGEHLLMNGITLTVEFSPSPDLQRVVMAKQFIGRGGPPIPTNAPLHEDGARAWIARVENSEAFRAAFDSHQSSRFYFLQSDV